MVHQVHTKKNVGYVRDRIGCTMLYPELQFRFATCEAFHSKFRKDLEAETVGSCGNRIRVNCW